MLAAKVWQYAPFPTACAAGSLSAVTAGSGASHFPKPKHVCTPVPIDHASDRSLCHAQALGNSPCHVDGTDLTEEAAVVSRRRPGQPPVRRSSERRGAGPARGCLTRALAATLRPTEARGSARPRPPPRS